jgi:hypothetical protein
MPSLSLRVQRGLMPGAPKAGCDVVEWFMVSMFATELAESFEERRGTAESLCDFRYGEFTLLCWNNGLFDNMRSVNQCAITFRRKPVVLRNYRNAVLRNSKPLTIDRWRHAYCFASRNPNAFVDDTVSQMSSLTNANAFKQHAVFHDTTAVDMYTRPKNGVTDCSA